MTLIKQFLNDTPCHTGPLDRGLQFGDGHFTTIRILNGIPEHLDAHLARLAYANKALRIQHSGLDTLKNRLNRLAEDTRQGVCKVIVTRGSSAQGYGFERSLEANEYIQVSTLPTPQTSLNVELADFVLAQQPVLNGLKTLNRIEQVLLSSEKWEKAVDDLVVCTADGTVIEAIQGNLFWQDDGQWYTPTLSTAGINGVMRQYILENNVLDNLKVKDSNVNALENADQIFICNSVRGAVPVRSFNGKVFGNYSLPEKIQSLAL